MTKGDRDRLRAEIAGRVLAAIIVTEARVSNDFESLIDRIERRVGHATMHTEALLDRLGLSEQAESAAIRKMADELRSVP